MREKLLQGFWLGDRRVEAASGTVSANGRTEHLPPLAVEVLLYLAHRPGELVSRHELLREVWGEDGGSDEALGHAISALRHGLGDHADRPEFVQTVPRRGYRLLLEPQLDATAMPQRSAIQAPFLRELMQRGVVQAGAAHLVVGWLLIQVADATFSDLGLPTWSAAFVTYVVVGGFPVVLLLAWFLEFTGGRLVIDRGQRRHRRGFDQNYLAIVVAYGFAVMAVGAYQATVGIQVDEPVRTPGGTIVHEELPVTPDSIAVLRFQNIGDNPRAQLFSDGLAEDVLDRLARVPGLSVASRTDAWSLPEDAGSIEVRRRLRVANYLEGSVRLDGENLRVTVQLINSANGFHRFSRTFDRQLESFLDVQREITSLTVANLRIALESEAQAMLATEFVDTDLDAYALYRRGREVFAGPHSVESLAEAKSYFEQALELDPRFAAAHAGLCRTYVAEYIVQNDAQHIAQAEQSCSQALLSNPNLYMVYTALGDLHRETNRMAQAELAYRNALERNPKDVESITGLAQIYQQQNRADAAAEQYQLAIRLQPGNWRTINLTGTFYFSNGNFAKAASAFRSVLFLDPDNWQAQGNLGSALVMAGRFEEAERALARSIEMHPDQWSYSTLGIIQYYQGEFDLSVQTHRLALELAPQSPLVWANLADALYFAGNEEAESAFQRAAELAEEHLNVNAGDTDALQILAWASAMLGDNQRSRTLMDRALQLVPNDPYVYYYDALTRTRSGDIAGAIAAIQSAVELGYPKAMLAGEPYLRALHDDRQFSALLANNDDG